MNRGCSHGETLLAGRTLEKLSSPAMAAASKTNLSLGLMVVALFVGRASPAGAITPDEAEQAFRGVEETASANTVRGWGADASIALIALADDPQRAGFVRARAINALRYVGQTPAIKAALVRLANTTQQQPLLQRAALSVLALTYNELDFVAGFLRQSEFLVREGAVWALAHSARPAARVLLVNAMSTSHDLALRTTFELALRELDASLRAAQTGSSSITSSVTARPAASSGRAR